MLHCFLLKRFATFFLLAFLLFSLLEVDSTKLKQDSDILDKDSGFSSGDGPATVADIPDDEEHEESEIVSPHKINNNKIQERSITFASKEVKPSQKHKQSSTSFQNLSKTVLVSTVDGKISAFTISPSSANASPLKWQFDLGKPLLSQSISQLLHRDSGGQAYRIIPALDGSLYRLDSGSLHSLPVNADTLLSTSYRLAEDTFVVGSKETLLTGISLRTGKPIYQCGASGCHNLSPEAPTTTASQSARTNHRRRLDDGIADDDGYADDDEAEVEEDGGSDRQEGVAGGVLTVRRLASTVRAVHSSGREDWHFQVAECELSYHACSDHTEDGGGGGGNDSDSQARRFCSNHGSDKMQRQQQQQQQQKTAEANNDRSAIGQGLRFDVTSGIVYRVDPDTGVTVWRQLLDSPIAQAWELTIGVGGSRRNHQLVPISVFHMRKDQAVSASSSAASGGGANVGGCPSRPPQTLSTSVYIGQFRDQYYVQQQQQYHRQHRQERQLAVSAPGVQSSWRTPPPAPVQVQIEFKPQQQQDRRTDDSGGQLVLREDLPLAEPGFYTAAIGWDAPVGHHANDEQPHRYGQHSTTGGSGHGGDDPVGEFDEDDDGVVYQVINNYTGSLWHYMPQIIILSLFLSVLVHLFVTKVLHRARYEQLNRVCSVDSNASSSNTLVGAQQRDTTPEQQQLKLLPTGSAVSITSSTSQQQQQHSMLGLPSYLPGLGGHFVSRYHTEFTHLRCLGRGGFGLVFEARHRIDDCSYAIKRVAVRNSDQARARILREVKALAKLDHQGIVRYYQAWFECPPSGWQERMDASLLNSNRRQSTAAIGDDVEDEADPHAIGDDALSSGAADTVASFGLSGDFTASSRQAPWSSGRRQRRKRLFSDSVAPTGGGYPTASPTSAAEDSRQRHRQRRRHGTGGSGSISSCCGRRPSPLNPFDGDVDLSATDDELMTSTVGIKEKADNNGSKFEFSVDSGDFDDEFDSGEFSATTPGFGGVGMRHRWLMQEGDTTADELSTGLSALLDKRLSSKNPLNEPPKSSKKALPSQNNNDKSRPPVVNDDSVEIVFEDSNPGAAYNRLSSSSSSSSEPSAKSLSSSASSTNPTVEQAVLAIDNNDKEVNKRRRRRTINSAASSAAAAASPLPTPAYECNKLYLYIQMQLCQKESLRDWLRVNTGERDRVRVRDVFTQICQAVSFVHQCNLIHRDLKSSNIFFALDGSVKIGDFGLATALMDEEALASAETAAANPDAAAKTQSAVTATWHTSEIGTRLYMSPEQSAGLAYSEKVDIFSLGLILFELCHPFTTEMERVTCMLRAKESRLPGRFVDDWPAESAIILRLLSPNPAARPSADEILRDPLLAAVPSIVADDLEVGGVVGVDELGANLPGVNARFGGRSRTSSSQSSMRSLIAVGQQQQQQQQQQQLANRL